jgi:twitching motility protein PilI
MSDPSAYSFLVELERLAEANAVGLPKGESNRDEWIGVGFRVDGVACVASMGEVTEILPPPETVRVPRVQPWVIGLANVRGSLLPVFDLEGFLLGRNLARRSSLRVLVVDDGDLRAGLLVPEVLGMKRFRRSEQDDTNAGGSAAEPYLSGAFKVGGQTWNVFSMSKLAKSEEFLRVVQ